jgi:hypothetical protein
MSTAAYVQQIEVCWQGGVNATEQEAAAQAVHHGRQLALLLRVADPKCTTQELQTVSRACTSLQHEPQLVQVIVSHLSAAARAAEGNFVKAHEHQLECQK